MNHDIQNTELQWPCELSDAFKQAMLQISQAQTLFEKENASAGLRRPQGVAYLLKGAASFNLLNNESKSVFGGLLTPCDWAGAGNMQGGFRAVPSIWICPIKPVECLVFNFEQMLSMDAHLSEVYKFLYFANQQIQLKWAQSQLMMNHSKQQRIAYTLVELLALQIRYIDSYPLIPISQQNLGLACGLTRPRVNQVLQEFMREGFISIERKHIGILDQAKLASKLDDAELIFRDPRKLFPISD